MHASVAAHAFGVRPSLRGMMRMSPIHDIKQEVPVRLRSETFWLEQCPSNPLRHSNPAGALHVGICFFHQGLLTQVVRLPIPDDATLDKSRFKALQYEGNKASFLGCVTCARQVTVDKGLIASKLVSQASHLTCPRLTFRFIAPGQVKEMFRVPVLQQQIQRFTQAMDKTDEEDSAARPMFRPLQCCRLCQRTGW